MTTSNEHNNAPAVPQGWKLVPVEPTDAMVDAAHHAGWSRIDIYSAMLAATPAPAPAQGEPFGYFRAEPFGWTDCAEDDEGAIALYERPQEVGLTDEEAGPILKSVFDAGWAACRDSELVGDNAKEFAWDMSGDEITERAIAALRAKGGK